MRQSYMVDIKFGRKVKPFSRLISTKGMYNETIKEF